MPAAVRIFLFICCRFGILDHGKKRTPAQSNGAPCSNDIPVGSATVVAESATMYSAKAPSVMNPAASRFSQYRGSRLRCRFDVDRQPGHFEHAFLKFNTPTLSPTFPVEASFPTCTTVPTGSWDGINGSGLDSSPFHTWRSEWQKPAAASFMRSSFGRRVGVGFVVIW